MTRFHFSVCTYNIWTDTRWPERRDALASFGRSIGLDILCLQEVQPDSLATLDAALPHHVRVHDEFHGWSHEGNIFWRSEVFDLVEHGTIDIGILEPLRRLFWVRLRVIDLPEQTLLVSTAHFTWFGHVDALASERNVRIEHARRTITALHDLHYEGEPQLFMGDLNDANEPINVLRRGGLTDCFSALGLTPSFTHPAAPTASGPPSTIDWLMSNGSLRAVSAQVIDFFHGDIAPSDHKPVLAVYELLATDPAES